MHYNSLLDSPTGESRRSFPSFRVGSVPSWRYAGTSGRTESLWPHEFHTMIGARLGPWIIDKELGRGGMGRVFLAHADPVPASGPHRVAVNVLASELAAA